ncbi:MAG: ATP-grasp domain-containing protein [Candidatus Fermentithermobacillus carboniphilus]|uniref:ATP-grasp domain-containing protein n=1 Tax=Candidatus Fermentithermobacillus carboniphilus TaxID=3085328 RepID=A0AAT9L9B3_9FIRM|nr:MAG: ATP-grasp domain-containing protein [Candidatus Fermentithermobacillus carboniphilus]
MLVAVVTNPSHETRLSAYDPHSKLQSQATSRAVHSALVELGYEVEVVEAGPSLLVELEKVRPDVVFNIATGYNTKKDQANIAAMLELSGIPFTGSTFQAHTIGLQKHLAKLVFQMYDIPTPMFLVFNRPPEDLPENVLRKIRFPVIVKPSSEGSSVGISPKSVTSDAEEMKSLIAEIIEKFGPPALVEEFVPGREFTVALVGYPDPVVLPIEEIVFEERAMYTYAIKANDAVKPVCPAEISPELETEISSAAKRAFVAVGCRDIARVDVRVSPDGKPFVLEINTLPGLMPGYSEVPRIAQKAGYDYVRLIEMVLKGALMRRGG